MHEKSPLLAFKRNVRQSEYGWVYKTLLSFLVVCAVVTLAFSLIQSASSNLYWISAIALGTGSILMYEWQLQSHASSTFASEGLVDGPWPNQGSRLFFLDGLRGLASLAVLHWHFLLWVPEKPELMYRLLVLCNGQVAVGLFFLLSGMLVPFSAVQSGDLDQLKNIAIRRIPRLLVSVFASILVLWLVDVMTIGQKRSLWSDLQTTYCAAVCPPSPLTPVLVHTACSACVGENFPWLNLSDGYSISYLWTISIEICGSLGVCLAAAGSIIIRRSQLGTWGITGYYILLAAVSVWLICTFPTVVPTDIQFPGLNVRNSGWYSLFLLGLILAELYTSLQRRGIEPQGSQVCAFLAISLPATACLHWFFSSIIVRQRLYDRVIQYDWCLPFWTAVVGVAFIACVCVSRTMQAFLSLPPIHFLGRSSFGLYLLHPKIIMVIKHHLWTGPMTEPTTLGLLYGCTIAFTYALAGIFTLAVDEPVSIHGVKWAQKKINSYFQLFWQRVAQSDDGT